MAITIDKNNNIQRSRLRLFQADGRAVGTLDGLKNTIKSNVKPNGRQEITGQIMQDTLLDMVGVFGGSMFPLTVSVSGGGLFEKGTRQNISLKWTVKQGNDTVTPDSVKVNGTPAIGGTADFSDVSVTTRYEVEVTYEGQTAAGFANVKFVAATYYGGVPNDFAPTPENVVKLTKDVHDGRTFQATYNLNDAKSFIAYPQEFGKLSRILDANGFDYMDLYTEGTLAIDGELYYTYLLKDRTTINGFVQKFQ